MGWTGSGFNPGTIGKQGGGTSGKRLVRGLGQGARGIFPLREWGLTWGVGSGEQEFGEFGFLGGLTWVGRGEWVKA